MPNYALPILAGKTILGASLALGFALTPHAIASPSPSACVDTAPYVCAPHNPEGKQAACFDDGGVLVALWPCQPWEPRDGWRHGDGTTTFPNGDVMADDGTVIIVGDHSHDIPAR